MFEPPPAQGLPGPAAGDAARSSAPARADNVAVPITPHAPPQLSAAAPASSNAGPSSPAPKRKRDGDEDGTATLVVDGHGREAGTEEREGRNTGGLGARRRRQPLIVVASLIDKLPNLGGIARTCEILGARSL